MRPLGISIYETTFQDHMSGFRAENSCDKEIKYVHKNISNRRINYIVDADIKRFL